LEEAPQIGFGSREIEVGASDLLLVASDGIGSINNPQGEYFEERRLKEELGRLAGKPPGETLNALLETAVAFGQREDLPDDVNLVGASRPPAEEEVV
jgi:serine phosphatase RsbU (regulator of sigma subunit)